MKTLRLVGKLFAIGLVVLGINSSCKKDKDDNCITCTYTYEDGTTDTETICEGEQDEWFGEDISWDDFLTYVRAIDAISDDISCN
jgi:hypothetical protein